MTANAETAMVRQIRARFLSNDCETRDVAIAWPTIASIVAKWRVGDFQIFML